MNIEQLLPEIEVVAEAVHRQWMTTKLSQGVTSRKSETGEEMMVEYSLLSEPCKDLDRNTVKAVYAAIVESVQQLEWSDKNAFRNHYA